MKQNVITKKHLKKTTPIVLLIALVVWLLVWGSSPKQGRVASPPPSQKISSPAADKVLDGTYITFGYSGKYTAKSEGPKNNELEIHTLSANTHFDKQIIASVSNLPDGQISSYGAYMYRKLHTDLYTSHKAEVGGTVVDVWVKKDGTEQTVMLPRGNKVATITFTTASTTEQLAPEFNALLRTFRWK